MHKVFTSYHHAKDQYYKDWLVRMGENYEIFIDRSVDTGDISDNLTDQAIREKIRDDYLRDSTVTIVLVGEETKRREHVDWEIYSSMIDGRVNKKSGILTVSLPSIETSSSIYVSHSGEKKAVYPDIHVWQTLTSRTEFESYYPYMPDRIIDNLLEQEAKVSVTAWSRIENNPKNLQFLIDAAFEDRAKCKYDLRRPMRRNNS
ncbi:MAG: TIR domain-containing protein [Candidatus Poribacteria bacterium]|nr:TIR domain-containing protein [Candidatus Poribacteria bacterium]MDE0502488.1 TIR domain-containing protein [Candidatus Poribacteria bacterium]